VALDVPFQPSEFHSTQYQQIQQHLKDFDFKHLFIETLKWNRPKSTSFLVPVDKQSYKVTPLAEKASFVVYRCTLDVHNALNKHKIRAKVEREVAKHVHEHIIIFTNTTEEQQIWQFVRHQPGRPLARREDIYRKGQSGDLLAQKLQQLIIDLKDEEGLTISKVTGRVNRAFDTEPLTKEFYPRFKAAQQRFMQSVQGIPSPTERQWYTTLMLTRLMLVYFVQRKGILNGDRNYLLNQLHRIQKKKTGTNFLSFYRDFLLCLFHDGFSTQDRTPELEERLGRVPYLNGSLFDKRELEETNTGIHIPDEEFERIFVLFDEFDWHLDTRIHRSGKEINPDVLGYIFEQLVNEKENHSGTYYTKEDITEYISKSTTIPYLFDAVKQKHPRAFAPSGPIWRLLQADPDRYIQDTTRKGCKLPLPPNIEAGIQNVSRRADWNDIAPDDLTSYALPGETWREVVERRWKYTEIHTKLAGGEVYTINDLITYNLDIFQFMQDVIDNCEDVELLHTLYYILVGRTGTASEPAELAMSILDPTCGSGAFLLAALNILEPIYEACLDRMENMLEESNLLVETVSNTRSTNAAQRRSLVAFRTIVNETMGYPSRKFFMLKSIIVNNLYGVDISKEAGEICKLRLFLRLMAEVDTYDQTKPLPNVDFSIYTGNTLIGFLNLEEVRATMTDLRTAMTSKDNLERIEVKAQAIEQDIEDFRIIQMQPVPSHDDVILQRSRIQEGLKDLRSEFDRFLAAEYAIDQHNISNEQEYHERFEQWRKDYQPFHWFIEFHGIMKSGGFSVIIGNPPYVEYYETKFSYTLQNFETLSCANLYTYVIERSHHLLSPQGYHGMILPISAFSTRNMTPFIEGFQQWFPSTWLSFYHFRPSMLFSGGKVASIPTAIYIAHAQGNKLRFSTNLMKWSSEHRDVLFSSLFYNQTTAPRDLDNRHYYPKYGSSLENGIMEKVLTHRRVHTYLTNIPNQNTMYYRSAGGLYWKVFVNFPWPYQATSNKRCFFQNGYDCDVFVTLFNSSLFWWYYTATFDTFNLKDYMIFGFRFSYPQDTGIVNALQTHCHHLMDDFRRNAKHLKRGKTDSYTLYAKKSKLIIDEIDRVLAQHYGFTDEELDFIINYDIKYRMGKYHSEEEEE